MSTDVNFKREIEDDADAFLLDHGWSFIGVSLFGHPDLPKLTYRHKTAAVDETLARFESRKRTQLATAHDLYKWTALYQRMDEQLQVDLAAQREAGVIVMSNEDADD